MLLSDRVYTVLKQIAQLWLPAIGTLYFTLAQIWGLPAAEAVGGTIMAVDTFLGALLGLSSKTYNNSDVRFDGNLAIEETEDGSVLRMQNVDHKALLTKDSITFKINSNVPS